MTQTDEFLTAVEGKYRLPPTATKWIPDGESIPRPDCTLTTLQILSAFPLTGFLGIDHFYLRSPITGIAKLATLGGFGFWYLWDALQVTTERERVLTLGLTLPFDFMTGIGMGSITDEPTNYASKSWYSLWLFGIIFGFVGLDSLIARNGGQAMRKILEFSLFMMFLMRVLNVFTVGLSFGAIISIMCMIYLGSIIIAEYISVISIVMTTDILKTGIVVDAEADKQYNSVFRWMINSVSDDFISHERKEKIIGDLEYGSVNASELRRMFTIHHVSQEEPKKSVDKNNSDSSWISFGLLMVCPFILVASMIWSGIDWILDQTIPWYGPAKALRRAAASAMDGKIPDVAGLSSKITAATQGTKDLLGSATQGTKDLLGSATQAAKAVNPVLTGGARSQLSAESQIMGAAVIALIAGGSLKGLIDYLMKE